MDRCNCYPETAVGVHRISRPIRRHAFQSVGSAAGRSSPARAALAARRRAATWHAAGAVSDPNNSLERQEGWRRPCWGRAISRVRGSLREQRGEGCLELCELHVSCVAGRRPPAGTAADVAQVHVTDALNAAHSEAAHDGPVRNPISNRTIVCGLAAGRACAC